MDFFSDSADSLSSSCMSPSLETSDTIAPRNKLENIRKLLQLQPLHSAKKFSFNEHHNFHDEEVGSSTVKSSTMKRKFADFYLTLEKIGQGSCGIVKKVQSLEDNQIYVAKILKGRHQEHLDQIKREFQILSMLNHKSIVKAKELLIDEVQGTAHLILEYVPGFTLEQMIIKQGKLEEKIVRHIVEQLISALKHVHDHGVCHRDITTTNIIINENLEVKLIDFSVSKIFREELFVHREKISASLRASSPFPLGYHNCMMSNIGTDFYKAPEVVTGVPYNHSADMWSLGVITFFALSGYLPFKSKYLHKLYEKINSANYKWNVGAWSGVSQEAILFVKACLKQFPFIRLSTKEALYHPWIKGIQLNLENSSTCEKGARPKNLSPPPRTSKREQALRTTKPRKSFILNINTLN